MVSFHRDSPPKPRIRLSSPHTRYMPNPSHTSRFYHTNILVEVYRSLRSSLCSFLHSPVTSSLLGPNILHNTLFSKTDNGSFEMVEEFEHFGTTLKNQNSVQEEIKSRLKLGNACYHSVQNLLSSCLLFKYLEIKNLQNYYFSFCFVRV